MSDVATRAQRLLPGQRVRYAFTAEPWAPSFFTRWWMLIRGGARVVAVTDRDIVVMRTGGAAMNRKLPRRVIYTLPRAPLPVRRVAASNVIDLGREQICVGPGVKGFLADADAWAFGDAPPPEPVKPVPAAERRASTASELTLLRLLAVVGWLAVFGLVRLLGARPAGLVYLHLRGSRVLYELVGLLVVGLFMCLAAGLVIGGAFLLRSNDWATDVFGRPAGALLRLLGVGRAKRAREERDRYRRAARLLADDRSHALVGHPWGWEQRPPAAPRDPPPSAPPGAPRDMPPGAAAGAGEREAGPDGA